MGDAWYNPPGGIADVVSPSDRLLIEQDGISRSVRLGLLSGWASVPVPEVPQIQELTADGNISADATTVFVTTESPEQTVIASTPVFAGVGLNRRIEIVHTTGSAGLVVIPAADGLPDVELAPGQGIIIMKRAAAWQIIGRI